MRQKLVRILALSVLLATLTLTVHAPSASAYGNVEQWQTTFSVTCNNTTLCFSSSTFGIWGWCAFGGSNGSSAVGTTGTTADCQFSVYTRPPANNVVHFTYDVTSWQIENGSVVAPPGIPSFFVTGGTFEVQGPGATFGGLPTGVPIPFPNPCPTFLCDTGIPAIPGHFDFHPFPGFEINSQVTKLL